MDLKLFADWLKNGFDEALKKQYVQQPVVLLIDGAKVHLSIEALEFCAENKIILYTLYLNATHLIQPLDLALMGLIKKIYEEMRKWVMANIREVFDKYRFVEVFKATYEQSCILQNAVEGFECSGIVP